MDTVGARIRQIRTDKGITQADLANALETTTAAVSRYELGQRELRFEQVQTIADVLGVSVFELYGFPSERQTQLENLQRIVTQMKKQIQHNLDEYPDEQTLKINESIQLAIDETERKLKAEIDTATIMHRIQVRADAVNQAVEAGPPMTPRQITPADKQRNKRMDNLITMLSKHPADAQNRILEVVSTFEQLNSAGQKQAVKRIKELAELAKYQAKQES